MKRTRAIAVTGFLIALSVILTRFASFRVAIGGIEGIRVGIGSLPNIMAGILLSPWYGLIAGAFSDILGFVMSPMGSYMPHFTLTSALFGAIPGIVFRALNRGRKPQEPSLVHLGISVACAVIVVSWGLTPYFLNSLFGLDYRVIMPVRIVEGIITIAAYPAVLKGIYSPVARLALNTQAT
ncbi:MAG: folate family ECF transporter S component [Bacillota bacterium]|jgi:ECF transporter S component (folate family)|nr:folate family ECF transporter S component [Candidatus Fermentithermobacillaceae bacterium]HOA71146.1 folate family ECF transporter S component [Bacillota bacterium]HOP71188.1 folate family ECF transporter S component [Bacillota bacterium]HPT35125.1 folate family ECF transporter S component [Bacillota bacterium]HPZ85653.1 folate family ECF transporter S component [Bacillota bacterium]